MKTKLGWSQPQNMQALCLDDSLAVEPAVSRSIDPAMSREAFRHFLAFQQRDEDRRLSAAAAFFIFLFGVGCGATWTVLFIWLF